MTVASWQAEDKQKLTRCVLFGLSPDWDTVLQCFTLASLSMGNAQSSTFSRTTGALDSYVTELGGDIVYDRRYVTNDSIYSCAEVVPVLAPLAF